MTIFSSKTFILNAIEFIGTQAAILVAGAVIGYAIGWTPEFSASVVVAVQMGVAGWTIRGWL
jgi:hypothetical protein